MEEENRRKGMRKIVEEGEQNHGELQEEEKSQVNGGGVAARSFIKPALWQMLTAFYSAFKVDLSLTASLGRSRMCFYRK